MRLLSTQPTQATQAPGGENRQPSANPKPTFLQVAAFPPRPIGRFPQVQLDAVNQNRLPPDTGVNKKLAADTDRTEHRIVGYQPHERMRVETESSIEGAQALRQCLSKGRIGGPVAVIPIIDKRRLYIVGEPRYLTKASTAYSNFQTAIKGRSLRLPDARFTMVAHLE